MSGGPQSFSWQAIVQGVAIVYGFSFLSGLVLAFNGITPEAHRTGYFLLALLTQAAGVAIALRVAATTRLTYVIALGVGVWLLNATAVWIGAQSFNGWVNSSAFVGLTLILGRLLLGRQDDDMGFSALSTEPRMEKQHT
jgi:hypothetical protein